MASAQDNCLNLTSCWTPNTCYWDPRGKALLMFEIDPNRLDSKASSQTGCVILLGGGREGKKAPGLCLCVAGEDAA